MTFCMTLCMTYAWHTQFSCFSDIKEKTQLYTSYYALKSWKIINFLFFEVFLHDIWFCMTLCMTLCMTYGWQMHDMCISDAWQTHHSIKSWLFIHSIIMHCCEHFITGYFCMPLCMTLYTMPLYMSFMRDMSCRLCMIFMHDRYVTLNFHVFEQKWQTSHNIIPESISFLWSFAWHYHTRHAWHSFAMHDT